MYSTPGPASLHSTRPDLHSHSHSTVQSMMRWSVLRAWTANTAATRHCRISPWVACSEPQCQSDSGTRRTRRTVSVKGPSLLGVRWNQPRAFILALGQGNAVEHLFGGLSLCNGAHLPVSPDQVAGCTNLEGIRALVSVLEELRCGAAELGAEFAVHDAVINFGRRT